MKIINSDSGDNKLLWFILRTAAGIVMVAGSAWASWVSTTIFKYADVMSEINARLVRIEQKLTDHFEADKNARH